MKLKICLPLVIALVVVLGTVGIVLGATVVQRTVNVSVVNYEVTIDPEGALDVQIYRGTSETRPYRITNNEDFAVHVSVSYIGLQPGITVSADPSEVDIGAGTFEDINITFTASQDAPAGATITLNFTFTRT